eukprot:TRINITY_DN13207_c0_g1_i1.p1 TRINITY_DN13207_c0_g1~~TRINITY_DN13207_c0_g1_i1.p1  ORF type:complete len:588 (+),score=180.88 TRINITY_DN13207_c0_g1_i1:156-1919(+)
MPQLAKQIELDWDALEKHTHVFGGQLCTVVHLVLGSLQKGSHSLFDHRGPRGDKGGTLPLPRTPEERSMIEVSVTGLLAQALSAGHGPKKIQSDMGGAERHLMITQALGAGPWSGQPCMEHCWSFQSPVTYKMFELGLACRGDLLTLKTLIEHEEELSLIAHLVSILKWHALLFGTLVGQHALTRDQAWGMSNADVLKLLPEAAQQDALAVFEGFALGFNTVLPKIELLFECEANPFIGRKGDVDLSGTKTGGGGMCLDTPVAFALPYMARGEVDAAGLCTIAVVNRLGELQNTVLQDQKEAATIPVLSFLSSPLTVAQHLLVYERSRDLLPLIEMHHSTEGGFDFQAIEAAVSNQLFGCKSAININIVHYPYKGQLQKSGQLSLVASHIPQVRLNSSVIEALTVQIDTQAAALALLSVLEDSINFIAAFGSAQMMAVDSSFEQFVCDTMLQRGAWEGSCGFAALEQVQLKHIQSLFVMLEEKISGSLANRVALLFQDALEEADLQALQDSAPKMDLGILLPLMHDFLSKQIEDCEPEAELREYLTYAAAVDLEGLDWFELFPEGPRVRHAMALYTILTTLEASPSA